MKTFKAWEAYAKAQGFDVEINDATPNHIVLNASACKSGIVWGEFDLEAQVSTCVSLEDYIYEREQGYCS